MKVLFMLCLMSGFLITAPASAEDITVTQFCKILPVYTPSPDVNYQPGVDVKGKPVMPADINTPIISTTKVLHVPVTIDLAQRANLGLPADTEMQSTVAMLNIYEDGRVDYNGQDISANAAHLCESVK